MIIPTVRSPVHVGLFRVKTSDKSNLYQDNFEFIRVLASYAFTVRAPSYPTLDFKLFLSTNHTKGQNLKKNTKTFLKLTDL